MSSLWMYVKVFAVGGFFCVFGQVLIDQTKLTPARILSAFVVLGVVMGALDLYRPLVEWAGAGATVPLTGFGNTLAKGVRKAVSEKGLLGVFTGQDPIRANNRSGRGRNGCSLIESDFQRRAGISFRFERCSFQRFSSAAAAEPESVDSSPIRRLSFRPSFPQISSLMRRVSAA